MINLKLKNWDIFYLFFSFLMYFLGVGIVRYYGGDISKKILILGLIWITCILISDKFMEQIFSWESKVDDVNNGNISEKRRRLLVLELLFFLVISSIPIIFLAQVTDQSGPLLILASVTYLMLASFYLKPLELRKNGFYELGTLIIQCGLIPAFGFLSFGGKSNQTLFVFGFSIFLLAISHHLVIGLSSYANDLGINRRTLITNISWQVGIFLHSVFMIVPYVILSTAKLIDISIRLAIPALLTFPVAIFQIIWVLGIGQGKRPLWPLIKIISAATLVSTAYMITYSVWIN